MSGGLSGGDVWRKGMNSAEMREGDEKGDVFMISSVKVGRKHEN